MKTILLFLLLSIALFANNDNIQNQLKQVNKNFFVENKGQWSSEVKYLARVGGMNAWITNSGVVYDYFQITRNYNLSETMKMSSDKKEEFERKNTRVKGHVVMMSLVDVNMASVQHGNIKNNAYYNYFIGTDKSKWVSFVPLYDNVEQNDIYKNIDVKYYFDGNSIRYDYIIKPGADLSKLKIKFEGQLSLNVNNSGELLIKTSLGEVTNGKLYSYQIYNSIKTNVSCKFHQNNDGTFSLIASDYDCNKILIIDPLVYSTFIGGGDTEEANSIAIDSIGNSYVTGRTSSANFPIVPGAYQDSLIETNVAFITKLNQPGTALVFSTYLGGSFAEDGMCIKVDHEYNLYVAGVTRSIDFPTTQGAFQTILNLGLGVYLDDSFISKLNSTGSSLIYSTYLGGSENDYGTSIEIDVSGNVYILGTTYSTDFPATPGSYQPAYSGNGDIFITKLNPSGTGLVFSTYIGGSDRDVGTSIAIDTYNNIYITGSTFSSNFPKTTGAFLGPLDLYSNIYVTKFNAEGGGLIFSSILGGGNGMSIAVDNIGNVYVTGNTYSYYFPTTPGAYQTTYGGGATPSDGFVTKLNPGAESLVYSTYLGGNADDNFSSIVIDNTGCAYLTGQTASLNYPITPGAFQTIYGGFWDDALVTKLNAAGSSILYSSFLGGEGGDGGYSIKVDYAGYMYITGFTYSQYFPVTSEAFQNIPNEWSSVFVTKIDPTITGIQSINPLPSDYELSQNYPNPFNPATTINYSLPKAGYVNLTIYNAIGSKVATIVNEYKQPGNYSVQFNDPHLASGIYLYRLESGKYNGAKKFILLK